MASLGGILIKNGGIVVKNGGIVTTDTCGCCGCPGYNCTYCGAGDTLNFPNGWALTASGITMIGDGVCRERSAGRSLRYTLNGFNPSGTHCMTVFDPGPGGTTCFALHNRVSNIFEQSYGVSACRGIPAGGTISTMRWLLQRLSDRWRLTLGTGGASNIYAFAADILYAGTDCRQPLEFTNAAPNDTTENPPGLVVTGYAVGTGGTAVVTPCCP